MGRRGGRQDGEEGGEREREKETGEGVLDVSIRPGTVGFSTGKVATVGPAKGGTGGEKQPSSPSRCPRGVIRGISSSSRLVGAEARR